MNETYRFHRKKKIKSHHLGLVPHVLLAVGHRSTQRRRLYVLTPVGGPASTLLSAEQRGRYGCKVEKRKVSNAKRFSIVGYLITAQRGKQGASRNRL